MTHVISIAGPVQNIGKTATAINLATSFAISEKKTLLIDCDPSAGAGYGTSAITVSPPSSGLYGMMTDRSSTGREILPTTIGSLGIIPAGADFSKADFLFGDMDGDFTRLSGLLAPVKHQFDYIVIDTPSAMPNLLKHILMATDWIVIPFNGEVTGAVGLKTFLFSVRQLLDEIISLQGQFQVAPRLLGILPNRCAVMTELSELLPDPVLESIGDFFLSTHIPASRTITEGHAIGKPAVAVDIESDAASAYMLLADEIAQKIEKWLPHQTE